MTFKHVNGSTIFCIQKRSFYILTSSICMLLYYSTTQVGIGSLNSQDCYSHVQYPPALEPIWIPINYDSARIWPHASTSRAWPGPLGRYGSAYHRYMNSCHRMCFETTSYLINIGAHITGCFHSSIRTKQAAWASPRCRSTPGSTQSERWSSSHSRRTTCSLSWHSRGRWGLRWEIHEW